MVTLEYQKFSEDFYKVIKKCPCAPHGHMAITHEKGQMTHLGAQCVAPDHTDVTPFIINI
jgi:hypothetical protein